MPVFDFNDPLTMGVTWIRLRVVRWGEATFRLVEHSTTTLNLVLQMKTAFNCAVIWFEPIENTSKLSQYHDGKMKRIDSIYWPYYQNIGRIHVFRHNFTEFIWSNWIAAGITLFNCHKIGVTLDCFNFWVCTGFFIFIIIFISCVRLTFKFKMRKLKKNSISRRRNDFPFTLHVVRIMLGKVWRFCQRNCNL